MVEESLESTGPESRFEDLRDAMRYGLDEMERLAGFIQRRVLLESQYCDSLRDLAAKIPAFPQGSVLDGVWKQLRMSIQGLADLRRDYCSSLDDGLLKTLVAEIQFQKSLILTISADVSDSFHDFNATRSRLLSCQELHCSGLQNCEPEYRSTLGEFERRRQIQVRLMSEALKRFLELETRRLNSIKSGIISVIQYGVLEAEEVGRMATQCMEQAKSLSISEKVSRRATEWTECYHLPEQFVFRDRNGTSLPFATLGLNLCDYLRITNSDVPEVVEQGVIQIESRGMHVKNLYLDPVGADQVAASYLEFEREGPGFPWTSVRPGVIAAMIKKYFMDLPEPILPYIIHDQLRALASKQQEKSRIQRLGAVIADLPAEHVSTLRRVVEHLARVAKHSEQNGMTVNHLAHEFSKCLVRPSLSSYTHNNSFAVVVLADLMKTPSVLEV